MSVESELIKDVRGALLEARETLASLDREKHVVELKMNQATWDMIVAWQDADRTFRAANVYGVHNLYGPQVVVDELIPDNMIIPIWSDGTTGSWPV